MMGGDPNKLEEVKKARDILADPEKRKLYDELGEAGIEKDIG